MAAGVFDGILAGDDVPFAPGGDDRKVGSEGFVGKFEANLVVALAGAAVGQCVAAGGEGHFHLFGGQQGAGHGGAEEVLVLVDAAGADELP